MSSLCVHEISRSARFAKGPKSETETNASLTGTGSSLLLLPSRGGRIPLSTRLLLLVAGLVTLLTSSGIAGGNVTSVLFPSSSHSHVYYNYFVYIVRSRLIQPWLMNQKIGRNRPETTRQTGRPSHMTSDHNNHQEIQTRA